MLGEHLVAGEQLLGADNDLRALEELCRTTSNESQRVAERRALDTPVHIQPANSRERNAWKLAGKLRDLSETGCGALTDKPLMVGDVYWISTSEGSLQMGNFFARCVRCRMIREGSFEQGFTFFSNPRQDHSESLTSAF
ncbi:PilZ domain protein [Rosistilla carotiformis]|uniref:PilZ domain protein n=1 Tax=Rosistilla carotiformis TaxID=2528017 RepID=A0A518JXZ2_9BACT|nr:PilZ domain-containing protein [Rosistilla carotiformis]QDV70405.1 PilZ domain protein [Rosistilla carotiformis]